MIFYEVHQLHETLPEHVLQNRNETDMTDKNPLTKHMFRVNNKHIEDNWNFQSAQY